MSGRALPSLPTTGDPAHVGLEANIKRALDQLNQQSQSAIGALTAAQIAYTAVAASWVAPAPTTVAAALDRLAANTANAHPIP